MNRWQSDLSAAWVAREIDFAALRHAVRAHPTFPKATIEGMLRTLPSCDDLVTERGLLPPTRHAVAAANEAIHRYRSDLLLLNAAASGIAVGALAAALWSRSWIPLLALAMLPLYPAVAACRRRRHVAARDAAVEMYRGQPGFSELDYARLLASLRETCEAPVDKRLLAP